jgi:hypothetical protein
MPDDFESFPSEWEDSAIVSQIKRNKDGSLTVKIQVDVSGENGQRWQAHKVIRLKNEANR